MFRSSPQIRFGCQSEGNIQTKIWLKYEIFSRSTLLWALQNLIFFSKYRKIFDEIKLDKVHSVFQFERIAKEAGLSE